MRCDEDDGFLNGCASHVRGFDDEGVCRDLFEAGNAVEGVVVDGGKGREGREMEVDDVVCGSMSTVWQASEEKMMPLWW